MPCTRSMVTRSVSKPSTKSRGRAAAAVTDEDDMPPPPASPPPKARSTRTKKASKPPSQEDSQEGTTTSKSSVSSSTRSTRNRGARSKPDYVEVDETESNPPSPRPSRSTRQKPSTATKQKPVAKQLPTPQTVVTKTSTVKLKTEAKATASTSKGPTKRPRGRAKKAPTESVDLTTDEENDEPKKKNLTLEQLHKQHVFPLKTALSVCEVFPKIMKKIADTESEARMEREFQELMNAEEMPPPPAPASKPKGRGRKKRNRSPEAASAKTDLPKSFNFAENKEDAPATKKIILDAPTPEAETLPVVPAKTKVKSGENSEQEAEVADPVEAEASTQKGDKKKEKKKRVKKVKDEGSASEQEKAPSSNTTDESQEIARKDAVEPVINKAVTVNDEHHNSQSSAIGKDQESNAEDKDPKGVAGLHLQPKDVEISKNDQNAVDGSIPTNQLHAKTIDMEKSISPISKLVDDENNIKQTNVTPEVPSNVVKTNIKMPDNNIVTVDLATPETSKKPVPVLEETFVFETPKEDDKNKTTNKLNTTFTPELCFSETPKSSRPQQNLNETVLISKGSSQASASNKTEDDKDHVLAPESPEPANTDSANGKVHSLVKYFDNQKDIKSSCKADALEKNSSVSPDEHNPNATFVLPPVKKDKNPPSLMNVTVCVKKGESSTAVREDSSTPTLPPPKLPANPIIQESAASRTFVKEPPSLAVVLEEEDEKIARLSKQNGLVHQTGKPIKEVKKGISSSSSSSSNSSMKSAVSQPCLLSKHKLAAGSNKNGPSHGSTGKLHDVHKSKPLEDAERRRQELLSQKVEQQKKKNEEWKKKAEKNNLEEAKKQKEEARRLKEKAEMEEAKKQKEEARRLKEKAEMEEAKKLKEKAEKMQMEEAKKLKEKAEKMQMEEAKKLKEKAKILPPSSSSSNLLKKPTQFAKTNTADVGSVFVKPKTVGMGMGSKVLGIGAAGGPKVLPSFPKGPFQKPPPPPPATDYEMDESFKTASNSFLDATMEGHLSSYDITVYEDLDEDLKHRENKTIPKWASDKEALKEALFSMVLLQDYQFKIPNCFPKPDKNFRLFPNKHY
ncbi:Protein piccolo [Orchesella cincta]|uniref:Protein piccolo n=1 Tax=Orchesella cincta TaxID=48709 RepID=A0A1D2N6A4_ORCCI|nr:Protein piccolo [Orchesella cincta]